MSYDLFAHTFSIKEYKKDPPQLIDFIENERPKEKLEFVSPNRKHVLKWIGSDLCLISDNTSIKKVIFKKDPSKFGNDITITESSWSPDSKYFVVSMMKSGFWKEVFWGINEILSEKAKNRIKSKDTIYIVKRDTLKWKAITDGAYPFWFKHFPVKFTQH
jgi:hypothetical protein